MLKSKDVSLLTENAWMFEGDTKFLNMQADATVDSMHNHVSYCSFPRMGNSFLRMYLHNTTGIATGSDMNLSFCVDMQLSEFKGEETTDNSVWIKKSHYPL